MKEFLEFFLIIMFVAVISIVLIPGASHAIPAFARRTGESCSACHNPFPKLNKRGIEYKYNGYRFKVDEGDDIWLLETVPIGFIIEAEGEANWGDIPAEKDFKIGEVEILFAGPIGQRYSAFGEIELGGDGSIGEVIGRVQLDNVLGNGVMNVAFGNVDIDFPHLSFTRRFIHQTYLAQQVGHLGSGAGVELNGQNLLSGPLSSYRYNIGYVNMDDDNTAISHNQMASAYGTLTLGFMDHYVGLQYRYGKENQNTYDNGNITNTEVGDVNVNRIAANTEINFGSVTFTAAYFYTKYNEFRGSTDELKSNDYMVEALFKPVEKVVLGVRGDLLDAEQGANNGDITATTANATYFFLPNIYFGLEYRNVKYDKVDAFGFAPSSLDNPADGTEHKGRLFVVAAF
ncbi:MAG: hypothetical protein ACE5IH_04680 [Thermodesulfobacteriota bacterium]